MGIGSSRSDGTVNVVGEGLPQPESLKISPGMGPLSCWGTMDRSKV